MAFFAKFDSETGRVICTGQCSLRDLAEQEVATPGREQVDCVVQTEELHHPDDLYLDGFFVVRAHGRAEDPAAEGRPVAIEPITLTWLDEVTAPLRVAGVDPKLWAAVAQRLRGAQTRADVMRELSRLFT